MVGTTQTSSANAPANTAVTSTATCPAGQVLLGGGALVTTSNPAHRGRATVVASYPSSTTVWTATGAVTIALTGGTTMSVTAYALCSL